jgi:hypothetical protein
MSSLIESWTPLMTGLAGTGGGILGALLVYRQTNRQTDAQHAQAQGQERVAEAAVDVEGDAVVVAGFTALVQEHRELLAENRVERGELRDRVARLEETTQEQGRKIGHLEEARRLDRQWRAAAVQYVRDLWRTITGLGGIPPEPEEMLRTDLGPTPNRDAT